MTKTALDFTAEDMALYRATTQRLKQQEAQEIRLRLERARAVAEQAARLLREQFGAERVVLFGSVARGFIFHARSDIDLGVEGLSDQNFWRAWAALDSLGSEFEIDLADLETASSALLDQIKQEGLEL